MSAPLVDGDAALVLELTAHVDEHALAQHSVLAAVGVEWRKHTHALGHFSAKQFLQQRVQLLGSMVLTVNLSRYLQCLLRQLVKHLMDFSTANDGLARCHIISKFLYRHVSVFHLILRWWSR